MGRFTAHEAARAAETVYKVQNDKNVDRHFDSGLMSKITYQTPPASPVYPAALS